MSLCQKLSFSVVLVFSLILIVFSLLDRMCLTPGPGNILWKTTVQPVSVIVKNNMFSFLKFKNRWCKA